MPQFESRSPAPGKTPAGARARPPRSPAPGREARAVAPRERPAVPSGPAKSDSLPERLQSVIEAMSGFSLADVVVHRNSAEPARLGAAAFTRGRQIHLAPGQERHLAHEAWHAVQQKQGRVRPTVQMKGGAPRNDDAGLEREADVLGRQALDRAEVGLGPATVLPRAAGPRSRSGEGVIQAKEVEPTYNGTTKPTTVTLELAAGDWPPSGSNPGKASPDGWKEIIALGLSQSWVRFHVLNQMSGGKGVEANLAPTTQKVNQCSPWKQFEKTLKLFVDPEHKQGKGAPFPSKYAATVTYYTDSENAAYKKDTTTVAVKGEDFPARIDATLDAGVMAKASASLTATDGLAAPNKIAPDGWTAV